MSKQVEKFEAEHTRNFRIIFLNLSSAFKKIKKLNDPLVVDVTSKKNVELAVKYKRDYVYVAALANKGETVIILRNKIEGIMRLTTLINKAAKFERELVILYTSEEHRNFLEKEVISYAR